MPSWYICGNERFRGPVLSAVAGIGLWDSGSASNVSVSGGGTIATCTGSGGSNQVRSTTAKNTGKWYVKFQFTTDIGGNAGVGLVSSTFTLGSTYLGGDTLPTRTACGFKGGDIYSGNGIISQWYVTNTCTTGDTVELAIDLDVSPARAWWKLGTATLYNESTSGDPVANVGGFDISAHLATGDLHFAADFETGSVGSIWTVISGTPPSGFTQWT